MADVAGFFYPRTATGRASLLPAPPWLLLRRHAHRRVTGPNPARVAELLPHPPGPGAGGPGRGGADSGPTGRSCGAGGEGAARSGPRPVRPSAWPWSGAPSAGRVYSRCVYIWVDSDVALARGLVPGLPQEAGLESTRPGRIRSGRAAPRIAPGGNLRRHPCSAGGRRLAQAVVTLARGGRRLPGSSTPTRWPTTGGCHRSRRARQTRSASWSASGSASVEGGPVVAGRRHAGSCSSQPTEEPGLPRGSGENHRRLLPAGRRQLGRRHRARPSTLDRHL